MGCPGAGCFDLHRRTAKTACRPSKAAARLVLRLSPEVLAMLLATTTARFVFLTTLALAAIAVLDGCYSQGDCTEYSHQCDGNVALNCDHSSDYSVWRKEDCQNFACIDGSKSATCVPTGKTEPLCSAKPNATTCDGKAILVCQDGYRRSDEDCPEGRTCVLSGRCAESDTPDPRCMSNISSYCDGNVIAQCSEGYRAYSSPCDGQLGACAMFDMNDANFPGGKEARCVLSSEPDSRCPESSSGSSVVCDGAWVLTCDQGFVIDMEAGCAAKSL